MEVLKRYFLNALLLSTKALPATCEQQIPQLQLSVNILDVLICMSVFIISIQIVFYGNQLPRITWEQKLIGGIFSMFVLLIGVGHLIEPSRLQIAAVVAVRLVTVILSISTCGTLWFILPRLVATSKNKVTPEMFAEQDRKNLFRLIQMSPAALAVFDRKASYIEASPRWKEELSIDEFVAGVPLYNTIQLPSDWMVLIQSCQKDGETCTNQIGQISVLKTGKVLNVKWAISPWFIDVHCNRENGVFMVIEIVQDLVLAREAALAASEQKSIFLANMSHELRTPLNGILGFTEILMKEVSSTADSDGSTIGPETVDLIQSIKVSGESLLTLVNDILDFSKIEAGKMDIDPRTFSLRQCIENVHNLFDYAFRKKSLVFTTTVGDDVIDLVFADDSRLRQILLNLVSNALKFTNIGEIHLVVSVNNGDANMIQFDISDTGIGIDGGRINALFKSFMQAGASTSRSYGGTGLGLAISKQLAIMMGGTMWVASTFGEGSTFSFTVNLPPTKFSHADILTSNFTSRKMDFHNGESLAVRVPLRILAAEDNIINTKLLYAILKRLGYNNVTFVVNGRLAVEEVVKADAANTPYDIILMDIQMPVLSGFDATRRIRKIDHIRQPKIVAVTASVLREELTQAYAAGMDDHVSKPIVSRAIYDLFIKHFAPAT